MRKLWLLIGALLLGAKTAQAKLNVGDPAPDFTAPASDGSQFHLQSVIGAQPIVLYFYPKDETPGCTKEACSLRDHFAAFRNLKAAIYGISYDTIESHQKFIKNHQLPFVLLSDADHTIAKLYGADGLLFAKRMTFVVDRSGKIAWINPSVNPSTHSKELEAVLTTLHPSPQ